MIATDPDDFLTPHSLGDVLTGHPGTAQIGSVDDAPRAEQEREVEGNGHTRTVPQACIRCPAGTMSCA
jgi:hypothetical protein